MNDPAEQTGEDGSICIIQDGGIARDGTGSTPTRRTCRSTAARHADVYWLE
jgi:hypothetical protein